MGKYITGTRSPAQQYDRSFQRAERIKLHIEQHEIAEDEKARLLEELAEHQEFVTANAALHEHADLAHLPPLPKAEA